jgi:hypothetical protein
LDKETPKALDKASEEAGWVSKETFLASKEARKGGGGRKKEIKEKEEEVLLHGCRGEGWEISRGERRELF